MLNLLASRKMTIAEIASVLDTTTRTVYRYFILLEEIGFCIEHRRNRYFLTTQHYPVFISLFKKHLATREDEEELEEMEVMYG